MRARPFVSLAALFGSTLAVATAGAQSVIPDTTAAAAAGLDSSAAVRGRAALIGRVHAENGAAIPDAELTVVGGGEGTTGDRADRSGRTGPGGAFRVDSIAPGKYFVRVRRLGYNPLYFSATLAGDQTRRIDVELNPLPARLSAVKVRARSGFGGFAERRLRDFEFRRRMGFGRFYTRDDLALYSGRMLSDALRFAWPFAGCRGYTGQYGYGGFGGYGASTNSSLDVGRGCPVRVSLDGGLAQPVDVMSGLPISSVEALEIYRSGWAPAQFLTGGNTNAALVVVWTGTETSDP